VIRSKFVPDIIGGFMTLPAMIASDVDGTLFTDDQKVTERTRVAVRAAVSAGVTFVLATRRPPRGIEPVVDELGFAPMTVCSNGSVLYDPGTDRIISAHTLSPETLGELADIVARIIPGAGLGAERGGRTAYDAATPQFVSAPGYEIAWDNPADIEVSLDELVSVPAVKLLIRKAGARSADMAAELRRHIGGYGHIVYSTSDGLIEILPPGVSKATGVQELAAPLHIAAGDVVAFGDMPHDVPMLVWAGHGVAMGNAHPAVVAAADEVTASNNDDGVARVVERWPI
jgi:Cof subfamily protein (haloacid dehalogenase superfamily)